MISKKNLSRQIFFSIIILPFLWIYNALIYRYYKIIPNNECDNINISDCSIAIALMQTFGNFFISIQTFRMILLFNNYDSPISDSLFDDIQFFRVIAFICYLSCTIPSQILFFDSDIIKTFHTPCVTYDSNVLFHMCVFGFIWFAFLIYSYLMYKFIYLFSIFLKNIVIEAELCECLKKLKINPITLKQKNEKEIQTDTEIFITLNSLKNDIKPFICIICMNNQIDILLKPCHHICMCNDCYNKIEKKNCPCCNNNIKYVKNIYVSPLCVE